MTKPVELRSLKRCRSFFVCSRRRRAVRAAGWTASSRATPTRRLVSIPKQFGLGLIKPCSATSLFEFKQKPFELRIKPVHGVPDARPRHAGHAEPARHRHAQGQGAGQTQTVRLVSGGGFGAVHTRGLVDRPSRHRAPPSAAVGLTHMRERRGVEGRRDDFCGRHFHPV